MTQSVDGRIRPTESGNGRIRAFVGAVIFIGVSYVAIYGMMVL